MSADKRGRLDAEPFSYRAHKDGTVSVRYEGRVVTRLRGAAAEAFLKRVEPLRSGEAQIVMAKLTGNFKRGNERLG